MKGFFAVRPIVVTVLGCLALPSLSWALGGTTIEIMGLRGGYAEVDASTLAPFITLPVAAIGLVSKPPRAEARSCRPLRAMRVGLLAAVLVAAGTAGLLGSFASPEHGLLAGFRDGMVAISLGVLVLHVLAEGWVLAASALYVGTSFLAGGSSSSTAYPWVLSAHSANNATTNTLAAITFLTTAFVMTRHHYPRYT